MVKTVPWTGRLLRRPDRVRTQTENVQMKFLRFLLGVLGIVLLASCGNDNSAPPAPTGLKVTEIGDTQVTLNWDTQPGIEYWVVYRAGSSIELLHDGSIHPDFVYREKVTPPYAVKSLINGTQYAFTVDAHINGGPGSPGATAVTATPLPGGSTWSTSTAAPTTSLRAAAWGKPTSASDNLYLGVGLNGTLLTGSDGTNWTSLSAPSGSANLSGAVLAFGRLVAIGAAGSTFYSADGVTFTNGSLPSGWATRDLTDLAFSGSLLVAVGKGGAILTSGDGISWGAQTSNTTQDLNAIVYLPLSTAGTGGFWLAAGSAGTLLKSSDASTWTAIDAFPTVSGTKPDINALAVQKIMSTTTTGATITTTYSYLTAAVGSNGNTSVLGNDAVTWTPSSAGSQTLNKVAAAAAGGQFLAVGNAGAIYTSPDGVSWTSRTAAAFPGGTDKNLVGLFRDPNLNVYVAYSDGDLVIRTTGTAP